MINVNEQTLMSKLMEWERIEKEASTLKAQAMQLRKECLTLAFPEGKIGTNTLNLAAGWKLKGVFKVNIKFDEEALDPVLEQLMAADVRVDDLIRVKREPVMKEVKQLSEANRLILEQAMITTPATPTLTLVEPKKKAAK